MNNLATLLEEIKTNKGLEALVSTNSTIEKLFQDIFQLITSWEVPYASIQEMQSADALFAFSFGIGHNNTPGETNKALAYVTKHVLSRTRLPIYAQWEIAEELNNVHTPSTYVAYPTKGYLNTSGVLEQFMKENKNIRKVIIIAHPDHQFRCGELARTQGLIPLYPEIKNYLPNSDWEAFHCDHDGYWKDSTQDWTTSRDKYIKHEIYARVASYYKDLLR